MNGSFDGRHVVVTGAAGALGGAVVERLIADGARVHMPVRRDGGIDRFAGNERATVVPGIDLTDEQAVHRFYESLPGLWASVHCAGGFAMSVIAETSLADLRGMWELNCASAFLCAREALSRLREAAEGRIVNVVSRQALEPRAGAGMTAYAASKAALAALTVALAEEVGAEGIRVNAVAPGILDTPTNREAMPDADRSQWVRVEDAASVIAFLASLDNRVAQGALLPLY